jgi:acyl-coenzyme A thioesterase 9
MRVKTPWVEALHQQQAGNKEAAKPEIPKDRDLTPRHMSDSYHSVVLPLAQDPWLLDTVRRLSAHCM